MKTGEIEAIIVEHFRPEPARRAAVDLIKKGVTEERMARIKRAGTVIPEPMWAAVVNAMRDIERGIKQCMYRTH